MKTVNTNSRLAFAKNSLVELNDDQLQDVNGGSVDSRFRSRSNLFSFLIN
ncbi:class I lanthipeptide [Flavobacterium sp.]|nr:class I lanthipeptide [Flavobacterium sp.]MBN9283349.1 class I lanthipeptide [Flavobacterium sp.]